MNREQLVFELDVLTTDFFFSFGLGSEAKIEEVLEQYFDIIREDDVIDKKVMSNIYTMLTVIDRERQSLTDDRETYKDVLALEAKLISYLDRFACDAVLKIDEDPEFIYDNIDDVQEWMLTH